MAGGGRTAEHSSKGKVENAEDDEKGESRAK